MKARKSGSGTARLTCVGCLLVSLVLALQAGRAQEPGERGTAEPLTEEEAKAVVELYRDFDPQRVVELERVCKDAPHEYRRVVRDWSFEAREIAEIRDRHPEEYKRLRARNRVRWECAQLARQFEEEDDAGKRKALEATLREKLSVWLDTKIEGLRRETSELEERLEHVRGTLQKLENNREKAIEMKLMQLTIGELEW